MIPSQTAEATPSQFLIIIYFQIQEYIFDISIHVTPCITCVLFTI